MRRSKMEMHLDILKTLSQKQQKLTHIMHKANINYNNLKKYMNFLLDQQLITEKKSRKDGVVYKITKKGLTILESLADIEIKLPIKEKEWETHT